MTERVCTNCQTVLLAEANYCHHCGLSVVTSSQVERRWCTVLFADVKSFTNMAEGMDAEIVQRLMNQLFGRLSKLVESHGGSVDKIIGDAIMALFGVPKASGDDAERAVLCGLAIHTVVAEIGGQMGLDLQMRVGINTGEVIAGPLGRASEFTVIGDTVNVAARLESAAGAGQVMVGETTAKQVSRRFDLAPVGELRLKGRDRPEPSFLVLGIRDRFESSRHSDRERLVGRDRELAALQAFYEEGKARRQVVILEGQRGFGRGHLLEVFCEGLSDTYHHLRLDPIIATAPLSLPVQLLAAEISGDVHLIPDTASLTYWLGEHAHLADPLARLHGLPGAVGTMDQSAGLEAWKALLETKRMAVGNIIVEEAHQLDIASIAWLQMWAETSGTGFILLSSLPTPSFEDAGITDLEVSQVLELGPLSGDGFLDWIEVNLGQCSDELLAQLSDMSGGTPAHLVELVDAWRHEGVIQRSESGRWELDGGRQLEASLPGSLRELLQARIDQLPRTPRYLLQRCAAVGRVFWHPVAERIAIGDAVEVAAALEYLIEQGWLRRYQDKSLPETKAYQIVNTMVTEVAAKMLPQVLRQTLHQRVADWLASRVDGRHPVLRSQLARHLMLASAESPTPELMPNLDVDRLPIQQPTLSGDLEVSLQAERLWLQDGNVKQALAVLEGAPEAHPERLALRAQLLLEQDDLKGASEVAREAGDALSPQTPPELQAFVWLTQAEAAESLGFTRRTGRCLERMGEFDLQPVHQVQRDLLTARLAFRQGASSLAMEILEAAEKKLPAANSSALRLEVLVDHVALVLAAGRVEEAHGMLENGARLAEGLKSELFQLRLQLLWIQLKDAEEEGDEARALLAPLLKNCSERGLLRLRRQAQRIGLMVDRRRRDDDVAQRAMELLEAAQAAGAPGDRAVALAALARITENAEQG
ncbi:MAG: hypothetical protein CMH55_02645 [Myxococcales bacterium]|nr:hypothetical protein [Myxococcales bacterium]